MAERNFALGLRTPLRKLTDDEVELIYKEIDRINADRKKFSINKDLIIKTKYLEDRDIIVIGSNVIPDLENGTCARDRCLLFVYLHMNIMDIGYSYQSIEKKLKVV